LFLQKVVAPRLTDDLGINAAGVKIALRFINEIDTLVAAPWRNARDAVVAPSRATSDSHGSARWRAPSPGKEIFHGVQPEHVDRKGAGGGRRGGSPMNRAAGWLPAASGEVVER
jgi:hypothetical protein